MPQLILRDIDFGLARLLRQQAAKNGRTPEEEHRAILEQALRGEHSGKAKFGEALAALGFGGSARAAPQRRGDDTPDG